MKLKMCNMVLLMPKKVNFIVGAFFKIFVQGRVCVYVHVLHMCICTALFKNIMYILFVDIVYITDSCICRFHICACGCV